MERKGRTQALPTSTTKNAPGNLFAVLRAAVFFIERQRISEHLATECELAVTACKYKRLGCDRELQRKDMAAHEEDDKLHLRMAMDTTVKLENKTVELENKTAELERDMTTLKNRKVVKLKLTNYRDRKEKNEVVESPSSYITTDGYHMAMRVYANGSGDGKGTHVSIYAVFVEGKHDAQLKWPFDGKVTFNLLNQLEDNNHRQKTTRLTAANSIQVGSTSGYAQFIPHSALGYDPIMRTQYLKDDTLYFRITVKPTDYKSWLQ